MGTLDETQAAGQNAAVAAPDAEGAAVANAAASEAPAALTAEEIARREVIEHNALARVFDDVRVQSRDGALVEPVRWIELGLVPDHMTGEEFEMFVYEYWEEDQAARAEAAAANPEPAKVYRSATRAVGIPPKIGKAAQAEDASAGQDGAEAEAAAPAAAEAPAAAAPAPAAAPTAATSTPAEPEPAPADTPAPSNSPFEGLVIPAGYELVELEGEWVLVPADEDAMPAELPLNSDHMVALVGAHSYYLYDNSLMTDAFARWSFLAAEDNDLATFAECVREESRIYPRPMSLQGLLNDPFKMTREKVEQLWETAHASGAYPDIERVEASNGNVYFYSTEHLSPTYAASLAEWDAVERYLSV